MGLVMILCFLGLALALQGSTAPSPAALDADSLIQVLPGPVSAPSLAFEPNVDFDNTGSPALPPFPRSVGKGVGTPVAAPANERHDPLPPVNDSPPQDPYISPTSSPNPSIVGKRGEMPSAEPPISITGAKPPTSHSPTKEPDITSVFTPPPSDTPPPSVVSEGYGMPVAAPRSERPEPVPPGDQSPIREPAWSPLPTPPSAPLPAAVSPTERLKPLRPVNHHPEPSISPAPNPPPSVTWKKGATPVAAPPSKRSERVQPADSSPMKEPASTPPPSINWKRDKIPVSAPPSRIFDPQQPASSSPIKAPSGSTWKRDVMPVATSPSKRLEPPQSVSHYPSTAPSPSTLDADSPIQVPPGPLSTPNSALEPNVNFNNTGSPALSPSPSIIMKGIGTPVGAPSNERRSPIPPVNDSTPQDPYISPTSAPTPSIVGKRDGVTSAAPPTSIPGAKSPIIQNHDIPSAFTPAPSIVAAAPHNERPEPVRQADQSPIREPAWSALLIPPPAPAPVAAAPTKRIEPLGPVNYHPVAPNPPPNITWERGAMPVAAPLSKRPQPLWPAHGSPIKEPDISPASTPPPSINWKRDKIPVAAPSYGRPDPQRPANTSHIKGAGTSPASNLPPSIVGRRHVMPSDAPVSIGLEPVHRMHHSPTKGFPDVSPASTPSPSIGQKREELPDAGSPNKLPKPLTPTNHPPTKGSLPAVAPSSQKYPNHDIIAPTSHIPSPERPANQRHRFSGSPPSIPFYKHHHARSKSSAAPALSHGIPPASIRQDAGPAISPTALPKTRRRHYAPAPLQPGSSLIPSQSPITSPTSDVSPSPSPSSEASSGHSRMPFRQRKGDPSGSLSRTPKPLPAVRALPPPPPNADCSSTTCTEPYTNSPPGSPCACVLPMQVGLRLGVDLYTFFPLVSELAAEVSGGAFMKQSQVRIMGANTASQQLEKTIVLIDLVPLGQKFDGTTAFLIFERFWHKQVPIKASVFGNYEVLYVRYPGLPPSPPTAPSDITIVDGGPYSGNNGRTNKPLAVDVQRKNQKNELGGGMIAIIVLSATVAVILLSAAAWIFLFKHRDHVSQSAESPRDLPSLTKSSAALGSLIGSGLGSASLSNVSSIAPYTGSAKTLSTSDIEKATDNYNPSRILGEGGFGLVYHGVLEDGNEVAVKVLKRDDQQGSREFLAEIEMLSRLHHRNLVKLIGMCIEERARCLVYELIPNGSVESHLHGVDKESSPLDWAARIKIALGAARGLAYLHEDSSPRVIHRDFKASNILLEDDFTPKVSDFGLARTAMDEENRHISTRVMGTFGYVAPEYAMTGHLLVKSDVYSYGVVLLELLTGKKPIDMSQAPGQENVVAWARPLLTSKEGLEAIIDPALGPDVPFDSISKVAAIASMCVQPEVSNRPFMGEVVQALKLVCNECEEAYEVDSRTSEGEDLSVDIEASMSPSSVQLPKHLHRQFSHSNFEPGFDPEHGGLSVSDLSSTSARLGGQEPGSLRRNSSLGPVRTGGSRQFWQRVRRLYGGSESEHGIKTKF